MVGWLSGLCLVSMASCAGGEPALEPLPSRATATSAGAELRFSARPRDLRAALMRALPLVEFAPLNESGSGPEGFFDFEIVGVRGEPGRVRAEFEPTTDTFASMRENRPVMLRVSIGRFGDAPRERTLAERTAREALTLGKRDE